MAFVGRNLFAQAANALGLKGAGAWFAKMETGESFPTFPLDSYASEALTVEEWFSITITSVGSAGFENFLFFSLAELAFPQNAWIMDASARRDAGSPTSAMLRLTGLAGGMERIFFFVNTQQNSMMLNTGAAGVVMWPWPFSISEKVANAVAHPVPPASLVDGLIDASIDPTIIGDAVRFIVRVRSAPKGVRVWGTW